MKLMINHQTHYHYSMPARNSMQSIKLLPQSSPHQRVLNWEISVPGSQLRSVDPFNNIWITASQRMQHQHLSIMSQGVVELLSTETGGFDCKTPIGIFLQSTDHTRCDKAMLEFALTHAAKPNRQILIELAQALLAHMPYHPQATSIHTTAQDAFHDQKGVCQDHAHVFIAMCRALQLPARYVSGYIHDQDHPHMASHAWAEVYVENDWYSFDISNLQFRPDSHIYVAVGRDYFDVAPIRGVRELGGMESMSSVVQVLAC